MRCTQGAKVIGAGLGALGLIAMPTGAAMAQVGRSLPQPVIDHAAQASPVIYDNQLKHLDSNGRFEIDLIGSNLGPDDESHPGGFSGGYVHIYVRGKQPGQQWSDWKRCNDADCVVYGGTGLNVIHVGMNPDYYLRTPGALLNFRVWVSWTVDQGDDPATSRTIHSDWSQIFPVKRGAAGASPPPPDPEYPTIDKIAPNPIEIVPGRPTDWSIAVFGAYYSTPALRAIFQGDRAHAVAPVGHAMGVDDQGHPLPPQQMEAHFMLPPAYRKPGIYSIIINNGSGDSGEGLVVVKTIDLTKSGARAGAPTLAPAGVPTIANPRLVPVRPKVQAPSPPIHITSPQVQ